MLNAVLKLYSQRLKVILLIISGSLTWSLTMVKSGLLYKSLGNNAAGMGFWGANGHDGIWHIALIESLAKGSLTMPVFSGYNLRNYHYGFDLIVALIHKITFIPVVNLYFQIIPVVFALLVGYLTYKLVSEWTKSNSAALWSTFFVYFGGSFSWLLGKGESAFWSQQAISSLINPPFVLSILLILISLILILKRRYLLASLIIGVLIEIKIYAGILMLPALAAAVINDLVHKHNSGLIKTLAISLLISLILFFLFQSGSQTLIVFQPFWFLETMMSSPDRLNWLKYYSALTSYKSGFNLIKGVPAYLVAFTIFWVGNLGTRLIKDLELINDIKNPKKPDNLKVIIYAIIFTGVFIPMFFVQKGTPWNTIQFFYYSLYFSGILAGISVNNLLGRIKKDRLKMASALIIVFLTIPTTILTLRDVYVTSRPPAMLEINEISALKFLSNQPPGTVLTQPFNEALSKNAEDNPPRPLNLYTSTAYVSAFSKQPTFLEDEINLDITGYLWQERKAEIINWFKNKESASARDFLVRNNIKYLYIKKGSDLSLNLSGLGLVQIFENNSVSLYKVD